MKKIFKGLIIIISISILFITGYVFINKQDDNNQVAQSSIDETAASTNSRTSSTQNSAKTSNTGDITTVAVTPSDSTSSSGTEVSETTSNSSKNTTAETSKSKQEEKKNESIVDKLLPDKVENKIDAIANGAVSASDLLEVIEIVGGKLSISEITFLFNSAKSDYWETTSVEDIKKSRDILFEKLSDDDLATLREFGKKYGRSMDIIKKDLDVAATKEGQMKSKGLID